ncbi:MAG: hypothetical protein ACJAZB_000584 [Psychrosphaera sp.]|jgi:hypothetical protein
MAILLIGVVVINLIWYRAKSFARCNGFEAHTFKKHYLEYYSMYQLVKNGKTSLIRIKALFYLVLLVSVPIGLFIFVGNAR